MLQTIEAKLKEVLEPVWYGSGQVTSYDVMWNYIVFFRDHTSRSETNKSFSDYYTVAIIHENWVPVELVDKVVEKMESISGVQLAKSGINYEYILKPKSNAVVEIATIPFSHARKKVR